MWIRSFSISIAMPQASFDGKHLHHDLFEMAAAYLFHITQNHPFIDGNKRTGVAAALAFGATSSTSASTGTCVASAA